MRLRPGLLLALFLGPTLALAVLTPAEAQQGGVKRVALICGVRCERPAYDALRQRLHDIGWVEGRNFLLDVRGAGGQYDRLPALVGELLAVRPDVMVAVGPQPVRAVKEATSTIPIVMIGVADPILIGLVPSPAQPGGNLTGLTTLPAGGFIAKQLELLKELLPGASRIAVFWNSKNEIHRARLHEELPPAAERLGVRLQMIDVRDPDEIERAFDAALRGRAEALLAVGDPIFHRPAKRLPDLSIRSRLPAIYLDRDVATSGGLMSYGPDFLDMFRRAAGYVDRILKGTRPGDMPIEQPTKFNLVINLKTAKALGLTIPPSLLLRADQVIE